jgi:hypothetical protein
MFPGIGNEPMRRHRLAGPDRAGFLCGVVAEREDEVHFGRTRFCEFVPTFAAQAFSGQMGGFELTQGSGMNESRRVASCTVRGVRGLSFLAEDGFGHDGARGISGAEEEDVITVGHGGVLYA